ncbi:(Fe-S)-binding protein [Desulfobulbus rhabdoformis]|uniref:(Fe-S)-binding protein n=1 Tax=Desulfobulbus rhabdoformis TaxID=34032 RepID=UPI001965706E|nr:(Fe-S)-binding protein [Desulfobulbus rhabdoformis]MBM9613909.1 (Fe-S)-binding protein [Desulfobulbus rhabdoformis]
MSNQKDLEEYAHVLQQCVRCGACQAHCPVYSETGREGSVARGKIVLAASVLSGQVVLDERLQEDMGLCLLCGSCVTHCPNQVPTDKIVGALRRKITDQHGLSSVGKKVAKVTGSKSLMKTLIKGAEFLSPLLFKKIPESSGLRLRFSPEILKGRSLPPLAERTLFDRVPEFLEGDPEKGIVTVFAGCALSYIYPQWGELLIRIPHRLGFSVYFPKKQGCCGMPALSSGNSALISKLSETNIGALNKKKSSVILTGCASCRGMLAGHYAEKSGSPFDSKILDIHQFLVANGVDKILAALPQKKQTTRITYHDPCHLRSEGITREPRALLQALPQADYVEMEGAGLCCGLGGTFTAHHPDLSRMIGDKKSSGLKKTGATIVASSCPGCILQLQDIIDRNGLQMQALHTLELIDQALTDEQQS